MWTFTVVTIKRNTKYFDSQTEKIQNTNTKYFDSQTEKIKNSKAQAKNPNITN